METRLLTTVEKSATWSGLSRSAVVEIGRLLFFPAVQQPSHINSCLRHPSRAHPIRGRLGGVAGRAFARNRAGEFAVAKRNARPKADSER
jgi:hypothetical protein